MMPEKMCKSELTGNVYKVTKWEDLGDGKICAIEKELMVEYHSEFHNRCDEIEQWIRISDGCYRNCWNCYAPTKKIWYEMPEITRNKLTIMDMNFLWAYPEPLKTLRKLGSLKLNNKKVCIDFVCGLDFGLLTPEICDALYEGRFGRFNNKRRFIKAPRIAWDRSFGEQKILKNSITMLVRAGLKRKNIQIFMLTNGKVPFSECKRKLDLMKVWNLQVADCWYDNQKRGSVKPIYWNKEECDQFGVLCRDHNHFVNFGVDPEWK